MNYTDLTVRNFKEEDLPQIRRLDDESDFYVEDWDCSDSAYGLFHKEVLIGYATIGYADDCGETIDNHPLHSSDSLMLSNVFISQAYRGRGFGLSMIKTILDEVKETVYLSVLYDELFHYYRKIGFQEIGDNSMVLN